MRRELLYSLGLHFAVALLSVLGLPYLKPDPPEVTERILVVDLSKVTVGEKTSLPKAAAIGKPKGEPTPEPPKPEPKPEPPKPEPPKPEPPKPEPPKPVPAPPKPEPPKPEPPKPAVTPEPPKPEPKKEEPKKPEPKPEPKKPEPPKPEQTKKEEPPKKKADPKPSFDDLLASVEKMRKDSPPPPTTQQPNKASGDKKGIPGAVDAPAVSKDREGFGDTLTLSEMDMIRAQIEKHWNVDPGKAGADDMVIEITVSLNADGTVRAAKIVDQGRMGRDPAFRSLAESALRAVFMASPIQAPQKKYDTWREVRLFFRPQDRL